MCLSNVKNIALAIQMYLADNNDTFPTHEHRQEALDYFGPGPGGGGTCAAEGSGADTTQWAADVSNPYLRWPVVLDEYTKNRDVWRCPSAKLFGAASFILAGADWLAYLQTNEGQWGDGTDAGGLCWHMTFPPGWGGEVTDSIVQQMNAGLGGARDANFSNVANRSFVQGLATGEENFYDIKLTAINDSTNTPIVCDGGVLPNWLSMGSMSYPDICCAECGGIQGMAWYGDTGCPGGFYCEEECFNLHAHYEWATNPDKKKASTRHLGGSNLGFADGHAAWMAAPAMIAKSDNKEFEMVGWTCSPGTSYKGWVNSPDCGNGSEPPAGYVFLHNENVDWYGK